MESPFHTPVPLTVLSKKIIDSVSLCEIPVLFMPVTYVAFLLCCGYRWGPYTLDKPSITEIHNHTVILDINILYR